MARMRTLSLVGVMGHEIVSSHVALWLQKSTTHSKFLPISLLYLRVKNVGFAQDQETVSRNHIEDPGMKSGLFAWDRNSNDINLRRPTKPNEWGL